MRLLSVTTVALLFMRVAMVSATTNQLPVLNLLLVQNPGIVMLVKLVSSLYVVSFIVLRTRGLSARLW